MILMDKWSKTIIQTYHKPYLIPTVVFENLEKYATGYERIFFTDEMCIDFLREHYGSDYVDRFNYFKLGAFKADLFRYCYLYKYGGIYLDIKTVLIKPLDDIFTDRTKCYSVKSASTNDPPTMYQGIIVSPPLNIVFLEVINYAMRELTNEIIAQSYVANTKRFWQAVEPHVEDWILFDEVCFDEENCVKTGKDQYGACCVIRDKDKNDMFYTRFANYPW